MSFIPPIEKKEKSAIEKWQFGKLKELLAYLEKNSPFYKRHFERNKISVEEIESFAHFKNIPTTTKEDIQLNNFDFLCVPKNQVAEYMSTSGTLGSPVSIALTKNDLRRLAYNEFISFACAGCSSEDVFQLALTLDRQFMAGIAYYSGIQQLGAGVVRTGPGFPAMQLESIKRYGTTTLVAVPSFVLKLIEYAEANKIELHELSVRKIVAIGESIHDENFNLNTLGLKIKNSWNVELISTYASTEMQTAFTECEHGRGGHQHPELIYLEILDENGSAVKPGAQGEVTITTFGVEGMPLLRYRTGDISFLADEPCACGRTTGRIGPILGRKKQMLKLKGTTVYPAAITNVLVKCGSVKDYAVEAISSEFQTDEMVIHVLPKDNHQNAIIEVADTMRSFIKVVPKIQIVSASELEKLHTKSSPRKISRFIDSRKN